MISMDMQAARALRVSPTIQSAMPLATIHSRKSERLPAEVSVFDGPAVDVDPCDPKDLRIFIF